MRKKGFLIATSAGFAAAAAMPGAQAADMPIKAPRYVEQPASWAGWYIGGNVGGAWQQTTTSTHCNFSCYSPGLAYDNNTFSKSGFIGGGQIGYNWQHGNFVFGLEGDISGLSNKNTGERQEFSGYQYSSRISWLSTVRGRFGLAVGDTMAYLTAGVAIAGVKNTIDVGGGFSYSSTKTRTGWTVGGGVEHMLNRNWTIGLEALFVDLGRSNTSFAFGEKTSRFQNQAVIGRLKLNYKF
jgi:outer membrane immunogenic protein